MCVCGGGEEPVAGHLSANNRTKLTSKVTSVYKGPYNPGKVKYFRWEITYLACSLEEHGDSESWLDLGYIPMDFPMD